MILQTYLISYLATVSVVNDVKHFVQREVEERKSDLVIIEKYSEIFLIAIRL